MSKLRIQVLITNYLYSHIHAAILLGHVQSLKSKMAHLWRSELKEGLSSLSQKYRWFAR